MLLLMVLRLNGVPSLPQSFHGLPHICDNPASPKPAP